MTQPGGNGGQTESQLASPATGSRRREDPRFLTGRGRYVADLRFDDTLHLRFVRSTVAHARLAAVRLRGQVPSGVSVFSARDLGNPVPTIRQRTFDGAPMPDRPLLAEDRIRFCGEPVAAVVAGDPYLAEDVAEEVQVESESLPPYTDMLAVPGPGEVLHEGFPDNVLYRTQVRVGDIEQARRRAARTVSRRFRTNRQTASPLETRGCVAVPDGDGLVLWSSTQIPFMVRELVSQMLGWASDRIVVRSPDLGGGFGMKAHGYAEEAVAALLAARLGRPVRWIEDRIENLAASAHARDHVHDVELHLDGDGQILGLQATVTLGAGAYSIWPQTAMRELVQVATILPGPYVVPSYHCDAAVVATNKCPSGAYRGVGRPSSVFTMERLMDEAAAELGVDPMTLRHRNFVTTFPYSTGTGLAYDSGSYSEALATARKAVNYDAVREEQQAAPADAPSAMVRGVGSASFVEQSGHVPVWAVPEGGLVKDEDTVSVSIDADGLVRVSGAFANVGQGQETTLAGLVAEQLGVAAERVSVLYGDTARDTFTIGSLASRTTVVCGTAAVAAAERLTARLCGHMAARLRRPVTEVMLDGDTVWCEAGRVALSILVQTYGQRVGDRLAIREEATYDGPKSGTYSNGCHVAVVDVDTRTGRVSIVRYVVVEDCGRIVNRTIVDGQVQGGVAQGIGGALYEELRYDDAGQLRTGTFLDYRLPSALETPSTQVLHIETPGPGPLRAKGVGEGGAIAPMAAIANAVADALRRVSREVDVCEVPLSPARVWTLARTTNALAAVVTVPRGNPVPETPFA